VRVADYVIRYLEEQGVDHAFTVCGGGSIFLNDALAKAEKMRYVACHHEQAAAMATEGYARVRNGLGVTVVTSGPGGTNAITGVAGAWTDSVPMVILSGQVFSDQTIHGRPGLRTCGVQEIDIVPMVRTVTKYAVQVRRPDGIRRHLERAVWEATNGRPGPVWLDLPADVQKADVDSEKLEGFQIPSFKRSLGYGALANQVSQVVELLKTAERPLLHVGQGVRLSGAVQELYEFLEAIKIPVVTARNGNDLLASDHPQFVGRPGTFAQRGANFAVQTCDLYIAIGTRLCLAQTGYNAQDYARNARIVHVDVDRAELDKDTVPTFLKVQATASEFLRELLHQMKTATGLRHRPEWLERCKAWQAKYPAVTDEQRTQAKYVNSYHLIDELSERLGPDDVVVTDMGFAFQNTHQAFRVKQGQRLFTNGGTAAMGWGLPAAIGAAVGSGKRVTCIAGDGGLMFNMQELSTLKHHNLPVKIFLLNNGGYLTMRQSQEHAFDTYMGSDEKSGISFPDFGDVAYANYVLWNRVSSSSQVKEAVATALKSSGPWLCEVMMDPNQPQIPKSVNQRDEQGNIRQTPIEDAWPYLPREEIEENLRCQT
jgi:acetolactate synthase-1/2/3 large subunit